MLRVAFVNMPFADWNRPSFALSQLTALLTRDFPGQVQADVCYLNQDVAEYFGATTYESISVTHDHVDTGLGDWLFRQIAFPDAPDNTDEYFHRFYRGERWEEFRRHILALRAGLPEFCDRLIDRYRLAEADLVGFSSMFAQHVPSIALARLLKRRRPEVLTLFGGANCEAPMGAVIAEHVDAVDYVFSGPALDTFPAFVGHVLDGAPERADAIPGVVTRRNCRDPRFREAIGSDHDIDDLLLPEYDGFLAALDEHARLRETGTSKPMLFFETSRGCWWGQRSHCTFCGLNGQSMAYRNMDPKLAIEQFNWLFRFAPEYTALFCTDNVMPRSYPKEVFPHLEPPEGGSIYYEVKLPLSRQDLGRMSAAGVTVVQPGIEALASSTLKLMAKGTTAFQNLQFLKNCDEFGISPDWNLLIGFPLEEEAVYERYTHDIPLLTHLPPPSGVFMVRFDRFSPYFKRRAEFELDLHPMDFYGLTYPFGPEALEELAYFFADHNLGQYMQNALTWHERLRELVAGWNAAWAGDGPRPELRLVTADTGGFAVRDSRSGVPVEHPVDDATVELLRRLSSPARPDQLTPEQSGGEAGLTERIAWLKSLGLLFEENGRLLSLVLTEDGDETETEPRTVEPEARRLLPVLAGGRDGAR
ncbi:RiPP maturation radical SAM C-methyltransferase [Amycolatopsis keratiniphila]|uniref:Bacteriocin maturation radical SAM protein 1 n=1 Tax=Amycolatopsis keratiniphila subsp. keratiniphila TaxID=227715 RepID=A0A1W2M2K7_9PSEU|nr:RiPP maturation radical SAM C-methyltransferase [Amycolatopsis keratiniphila]ONF73756.1 bacteriocin maturation radical SAM protein 1 [Amycolatopsis keratiniphila subsp. keratiniphila]